uniref:Apyrase n=1 Tax=Phlebotomus perniciosus TaxID=13204 RepID=I7L943_PHLPE|nr:37.3 kDa salivary protein SP01B [Phlebotomus perniciosus]
MILLKLCAITVACLLIGEAEAAPGATRFIPFALIADLDRKSIKEDQKSFTSIVKYGELKDNGERYTLSLKSENLHYFTRYSYNGRGAELSELLYFNDKLYTIGDKTGIVFEVVHGGDLIPWVILSNGPGNQKDGFKAEWATVKGDKLYVGSTGMTFLDKRTGTISTNALWVKVIDHNGEVTSINWENQYKKVKVAMGMSSGFVWHEAVNWSPRKNLWVFMPRKCSRQPFSAQIEEYTGCNQIITANENFNDVRVIHINRAAADPASGFSSFKFIPNTRNNDIFAIKTIERNGKTATYGTVIDINGKTLLPDQRILDDKYEGIAFFKDPKGIK